MSINPGSSAEATKYLVNTGENSADTNGPSIDRGTGIRFYSHIILLSNDIFIENLSDLKKMGTAKIVYTCT
ncbi:MAG: hypothetical protein M3297_07670 [Thermoproteota archaeon]|nr:hypothetical protein [Thermoproteota archaeon]